MRTPVALFIFNRPMETKRVFERIREARPQQLFIVADGARQHVVGEDQLVSDARAVVAEIDWSCEVRRNYAEQNLGCGERIASGLDWLFSIVPESIVLEDDCLPAPTFFAFMELMLETYRDDERVGMIAGMNYSPEPDLPSSHLFTNFYAVWGWASWARAWSAYDRSMLGWPAMRSQNALYGIFRNEGLADWFTSVCDQVAAGGIDTWDVQWFYSCLQQHRLCVVPSENLVSNIGYSGTRPSPDSKSLGLPTGAFREASALSPGEMVPDFAYEDRLFSAFIAQDRPILQRIRDMLSL